MPKIDLIEGPGGAGDSTFAAKLNKAYFLDPQKCTLTRVFRRALSFWFTRSTVAPK